MHCANINTCRCNDFLSHRVCGPQIYTYNEYGATIESEQFSDRVDWNGSKRSNDIQDASIYLLNVTFNDSGTYRCFFNRVLFYDNYEYNTVVSKVVHLTVVAKGMMK